MSRVYNHLYSNMNNGALLMAEMAAVHNKQSKYEGNHRHLRQVK